VAGWIAMAGYWYARNVVHTGNPVYPAAFPGWPGRTFPQTTLREYAGHYGLRRAIGDALVVYADWPPSHAVLAALGLLGLAAWLAGQRRGLARGARCFAAATLVMAVLILALLPFAPYSAGNAMTFRSRFVHWDSMRYIALVPMLGWIAVGLVTVFGDQWTYPAFGARAHLHPVRLDRDGRPASTLIGDAFEPGDLTVDPRRFRANLERAGIDVVVIVRLPHPGRIKGWPTQEATLEATGDARLLHRDGATAVWRLGATPR
jgi:hypothetical protein